jgi:hypothetical protein
MLRADPPPESALLPGAPRLVEQSPKFPFREMWIDKNTDLHKYKKIMIEPVNTDFLMGLSEWNKFGTQGVAENIKSDSVEIAKYMELSFINAVLYDTKNRFKMTDSVGHDTIKLELALIQLVPSKAGFNVVENVVGFVVWPVAFLTVFNSGSVAFEGIFRDSQTDKIICIIADRETDELALLNIPSFTYYGNAKYFIDKWSTQFINFMNAEDYTKLKADFPAKLIVW